MNLFARRLIAVAMGVLLVGFGLYKIVMLMAFSEGMPMPSSTRENLIAFANATPNWQRYLLYALFAALPVIYAVLWHRGRRADRLIRVSEGLFIRESAVSGFLSDAVTALDEVRTFQARCRMLRGKGLHLLCRVEVESQRQMGEIRDRIVAAVRACMAERMAVIPVARVEIDIRAQRADKSTQDLARRAAAPAAVAAPERLAATPPEPAERRTIDLSPIEHDEGDADVEADDDSSPLSLGSPLGRALLDDDERRAEERRGENPLSE